MAKNEIWKASVSAGDNARTALPDMLRDYYAVGRKLMDGNPSPAELHRFRLKTKRFRYTLELFRSFYGPYLDRYLAELRKIQDFLGAINDYATTRDLIAARLSHRSPHWRKVNRFLLDRTAERTAEFHDYWQQTFDTPGQESRWVRYLSTVPSRSRAK
jgi:CHAD domain-containing protein